MESIFDSNYIEKAMTKVVRLIYASTIKSTAATLRTDLVCIMHESRSFNFRYQIHSVLLYGNCYFYHCLEGPQKAIDLLYENLLRDPRHYLIKQLSYELVSEVIFDAWQIKYIVKSPEIDSFFNKNGFKKFNPYNLKSNHQTDFLKLLLFHPEDSPGQEEDKYSFAFSIQGHLLSLKYLMIILLISIIVLSCLYLFLFD